MARRLDILVPIFDEGEEVIRPLLDSIALQQRVDFGEIGVIVCCDGGSTVLSDELMARYPFEIEFHMCEHEGVSATRNRCLEHSTAEYVCWCDCDDLFCDACGLFIVFREMDSLPPAGDMSKYGLKDPERGFDILVDNFREETRDRDGNFTFIEHGNGDATFVHGKFYNRRYLDDNGLRYDKDLTVHEDSFFQILARECAKPYRSRWCKTPFYLWKWRDDSVCRHDPKYILKTFNDMIASNDAVVDELTRRMMPDRANFYCCVMCWDAFFTMCKGEWRDQENQEYRRSTERRFAEYFRKHHAKWEAVPDTDKLLVSQGVRQRSIMQGMLMEALTIDQWLERIQNEYPA